MSLHLQGEMNTPTYDRFIALLTKLKLNKL